LSRTKSDRRNVRLSVTLDEGEYSELARLGARLDLSAAWMIRRAVSEFIIRHGQDTQEVLPFRQTNIGLAPQRRTGGASGK